MLHFVYMAPLAKQKPTLDFLGIGDTMLDVFVQIEEAAIHCSLNRTDCQISFTFGEKIPVDNVIKMPGAGNAANASNGANRLGARTGILATVGKDLVGKEIIAQWKKNKIDTRLVTIDHQRDTNYSTVLTFQGERTILVYHEAYEYPWPKKMPLAKRIYYTSLGKQHEEFEAKLRQYLEVHPEVRLTFQPGTHHLRRPLESLKPIIHRSDIFILNKEEAEHLLRAQPQPVERSLEAIHTFCPQTVVITDGEKGSFAFDGTTKWYCPSFPGPCVERTGAGDSYSVALTWAIDTGFPLDEAMRHGTANAWHVIQFVGPQAGLLDREGINRVLRKFSAIKPTKI